MTTMSLRDHGRSAALISATHDRQLIKQLILDRLRLKGPLRQVRRSAAGWGNFDAARRREGEARCGL
jgi:hypothetical protein